MSEQTIWRRLDMQRAIPAEMFKDPAKVRLVETTTRAEIWVVDDRPGAAIEAAIIAAAERAAEAQRRPWVPCDARDRHVSWSQPCRYPRCSCAVPSDG